MATEPESGCTCHGCGRTYRVDVYVSDEVWQRIGMTGPAGLLCGRCIVARLEALGEFAAFVLTDLGDLDAAVASGLGSGWRLSWLPEVPRV